MEAFFDFTKLPPSQWGDHFLSVRIADSDFDLLAREIKVLKAQLREDIFNLSSPDNTTLKKCIISIHLLISLGISYHFENEIEEILKHAFEKIDDLIADEIDLYTISIIFRVFRTYGHYVLSDIFNRFKGNDGKFKESLVEEYVKGMLSFYEAVHFGTTTDHILDKALSFTLDHLKPLATGCRPCTPHLVKHIQNALHIPQHRNSQALVARDYITFYEQEEDCDDTLLKLAKLNFKFMQLQYFKELKIITMWWRELEHTLNLPANIKERTVESWFSALMINFEPHFSLGRIMSAKLYLLITFIDDACDIYGSVPEVACLVDCLESRWDPDYMENLQDHMKSAFKFVMHVFKEYDEILRSQKRSFMLEKMVEEFIILAKSNLKLIKWTKACHMPNFDEYMEAGEAEVGAYAAMACSIMGLGDIGKKEDFEWLRSRPKFVRSLAAKTRLMDDITDYEDDMNKGYTANAINYYMNQHGITKEETNRELEKMIGNINKIVNEEYLKTTNISGRIRNQFINFGRLVDVLYTADDVFNHRGGKFKDYIFTLLIDPIP
ncbi:unnamed protein product [Eruca vesicaria subsp. sativa]|uniref:Uncharacterized protein n=1 Tax=Eruca vesicaria subsp. sativa TaxID=29727 RepID=A0ABC8IZS0_ERUVS|nr:unnamed protein product [Eruca vesicaria subsp. sativa]